MIITCALFDGVTSIDEIDETHTLHDAAAINIETYRGVVQLTGFADSPEQAARAEAAAKKVDGVRSVKNDVRIKSTS